MANAPSLRTEPHSASANTEIDRALVALQDGAIRLVRSSLEERCALVRACIDRTIGVSQPWIDAACRAKRIEIGSAPSAEEILGGPVSVLRYLRLILVTLGDLKARGRPQLPGSPVERGGQLRVPTFPTKQLFDGIIFQPMSGETWLDPRVTLDTLHGQYPARLSRQTAVQPQVVLVLGAGNVSAIPATDALTRIFQNDCAVLLKMNPINSYLGSIFEEAFQPLVRAGFLRIIYGGVKEGAYAIHHPSVDAIHITGSADSHDAIVWGSDRDEQVRRKQAGQPLLTKPVTSELGNVTPWAIVPGDYKHSDLFAQAENMAASITNNVSFNCIATKVILTWRRWPARDQFLDRVESILRATPPRFAYYPGSAERFESFSGQRVPRELREYLPWTLLRNVDPGEQPHLFQRESFVCVTAECPLDADSPEDFLDRAVDFMNESLWGTLAAAITIPPSFQRQHAARLDAALGRLRYGSIGVNQWPGVAYALMSPPWGAYPGGTLANVQSGIDVVHNTYLLDHPQKTILRAPLALFPKPMWFSTHRRTQQVAAKLLRLYSRPSSLLRLADLLQAAIRG